MRAAGWVLIATAFVAVLAAPWLCAGAWAAWNPVLVVSAIPMFIVGARLAGHVYDWER